MRHLCRRVVLTTVSPAVSRLTKRAAHAVSALPSYFVRVSAPRLRQGEQVRRAERMLGADRRHPPLALGDLRGDDGDLGARLLGDLAARLEELDFLKHPVELDFVGHGAPPYERPTPDTL